MGSETNLMFHLIIISALQNGPQYSLLFLPASNSIMRGHQVHQIPGCEKHAKQQQKHIPSGGCSRISLGSADAV